MPLLKRRMYHVPVDASEYSLTPKSVLEQRHVNVSRPNSSTAPTIDLIESGDVYDDLSSLSSGTQVSDEEKR